MTALLLCALLLIPSASGAASGMSRGATPGSTGSMPPSGPLWVAPVAGPLVVLRGFWPPPASAPWLPGHRGVDLAVSVAEPVRADAVGRVAFAGRVAGLGVVVVSHSPRLRSTFEPVLAVVQVGDNVRAGEDIGRVEPWPPVVEAGPHCPAGPCLHWGMLLDGRYVDPLVLSGLERSAAGAVRLLPLGADVLSEPAASSGWTDPRPAAADATGVIVGAARGGDPPGPPGAGAVTSASAAVSRSAPAVLALGAGSAVAVSRRRRRRLGRLGTAGAP